jgi:hypothetical protein
MRLPRNSVRADLIWSTFVIPWAELVNYSQHGTQDRMIHAAHSRTHALYVQGVTRFHHFGLPAAL